MVVAIALALTVSMEATPAPPAHDVGVLPVRADESVAEADRRALDDYFSRGLTRSGFSTKPVEGEAAATCADADCYKQLARDNGTSQLVGASVTKTGPDYQVRAFVIDGATGEEIVEADGLCEICGMQELDEMVEGLAVRLQGKLATAVQPTRILVETKPAGAHVEIDGQDVGASPVEVPVAPGEHQIAVVQDGYRTYRTTETVEAGATGSYSYELRRKANIPAWAPWTAIGVGAGATVAGIVLLAIDGKEIKRDCNADIDGRCEFLHDTLPAGVVMTVGGIALVGTGVVLAIIRKRNGSQRRVEASAWLHAPGITLSGRF